MYALKSALRELREVDEGGEGGNGERKDDEGFWEGTWGR